MKNLQITGLTSALALFTACASPGESVILPSFDGAVAASAISARPPRGKSLIIRGDTQLKVGEHFLPALGEGGEQGVVLLEGLSDVTLDLRGVVLRGQPEDSACDAALGFGVVLRNCERIRILGGEVRGYRVSVLVDSSRDVTIEDLVVTRGFACELSSTAAAPDPLDRLDLSSGGDTWLSEFGAGFFIIDSSRITVRGCKVRESQNGLIALRSGACDFEDNDFSYLSGWGIALDESEGNTLSGNRCDFVARAASPGHYVEDYGAAGFLLLRGSSDNTLVGNSAVRCSVGALLLGTQGQELRGNRLARNDFSLAAMRSMRIEFATDSWILDNDALGESQGGLEVEHGLRLVLAGNRIEHVFGAGLALTESEACIVEGNQLRDCDQGLDVRGGEGHHLLRNVFEDNLQDLVLVDSVDLGLDENDFSSETPDVHLADVRGLTSEQSSQEAWAALADTDGQLPSGRAQDVSFALVGEAPLELQSARDWLSSAADFDARGAGADAGELHVGMFTPWDPAGGARPPRVSAGAGLFGTVSWDATWFSWDESRDPRGDLEGWRAARYEPLTRARVGAWTEPWGSSERVQREVGTERFGLYATGEVYVTHAGTYLLGALSDDGLRIMIDGKLVYENWTWHPAQRETVELELTVGRHELELEYFQIDGAAELALELDRAPE